MIIIDNVREQFKLALGEFLNSKRNNITGLSKTEWTTQMKEIFVKICPHDLRPYCSGLSASMNKSDYERHATLYDLCWGNNLHPNYDDVYKGGMTQGFSKDILKYELIMESEWGFSSRDGSKCFRHIMEDFGKLLQSTAKHKVMIYGCYSEDKINNNSKNSILSKLMLDLICDRKDNAKYLLIAFPNYPKREFKDRKIVIKTINNGIEEIGGDDTASYSELVEKYIKPRK